MKVIGRNRRILARVGLLLAMTELYFSWVSGTETTGGLITITTGTATAIGIFTGEGITRTRTKTTITTAAGSFQPYAYHRVLKTYPPRKGSRTGRHLNPSSCWQERDCALSGGGGQYRMHNTQPSALTLLLVRHGQAVAESDGFYGVDSELTELGRKQADAAAAALQPKTDNPILYVSPIVRAARTAEPLAQRLRLKPLFDDRLVEIEVSRDIVRQIVGGGIWPLWQGHHRPHEEGESLADFTSRVGSFFKMVGEQYGGQEVIVVAHGGVINELIRWALGFDERTDWHFHFELANGSVTEIVFWPQGAASGHAPWYTTVRRVGDTRHLTGLISRF